MTDWKEKIFASWQMINSMAVRRFGAGSLAEEAALAVIDGLRTDDWQRLRAYDQKANLTTFIRALSLRLLEDFARKRFGRVRPPLWVKTFGGIWTKLFTALCLERLPVTEAVDVVQQRQMTADKTAIESAAYQLLARIPDCGKHQGLEVSYEEDNGSAWDQQDRGPESTVTKRQKKELFEAIFQLVLGAPDDAITDSQLRKVTQLEVHLDPEEKLLLKLCYQDGLGVTQAGELLGLTRFQAHGKKRRLMARLRAELARVGVAEELRLLLEP